MPGNIVSDFRAVAGPPFVRQMAQTKRFAVRVNIDLAYYNGRVPYEQRTNRNFLNVLVPQVMDDLTTAIGVQFRIKAHHHAISDLRPTCTFELEGGAVIIATVFDSRVMLQAFSDDRSEGESLRTLLYDFKIKKNYKSTVEELAQAVLEGGRAQRKRVAKLIAEVPDPRFISALQRSFREDKSGVVRREAARTLGLMGQRGDLVDLSEGLRDENENVRALVQAFLFGNKFEPGTQVAFPRQAGSTLPEEKIAGVLLGGAVGDMMGYPIEFRTREEIRSLYGGPVDDLVLSKSRTIDFGQFSDDTEMTLMMAFSIEANHGFMPFRFAQYLAEHVYQMDTQGVPNHGYGVNTLRAARRLYTGMRWEESGLDHSTCSPAIRIAPLGLYFYDDIENLERAVVAASLITHRNNVAIAGGLAVALAVARLVKISGEFESSSLLQWLKSRSEVVSHDATLLEKIELAAKLAVDPSVSDKHAYEKIGNSSQTRDVVPLAFYSFFRSPYDYRQTVLRAVNAGGDADSAGSIAGALSGGLNGLSAIPQSWIGHLKDNFLVNSAIQHLFSFNA